MSMSKEGSGSSNVAPLNGQQQGMCKEMDLTQKDDVLKARLASDEKFVRRISKRIAMLAQARTLTDRYVLPVIHPLIVQ